MGVGREWGGSGEGVRREMASNSGSGTTGRMNLDFYLTQNEFGMELTMKAEEIKFLEKAA